MLFRSVIPRERDGDWICGCVQAAQIDPFVWRGPLSRIEIKLRKRYRLIRRAPTDTEYKIVKIGPEGFWRG